MPLFQLVPTHWAELLHITASHDLLMAEHTLHTVGGGGKGAQDGKYKKKEEEKIEKKKSSENMNNK